MNLNELAIAAYNEYELQKSIHPVKYLKAEIKTLKWILKLAKTDKEYKQIVSEINALEAQLTNHLN